LLAYSFVTLLVGIACLGAVVVLARRRDAALARAFLPLHVALTVLVFGRLLLAYMDARGGAGNGSAAWPVVSYLEAFVGRYGVMFALPFFAQRVFGVADRRRDIALFAIVVAAAVLQHVTEFGLAGSVWDDAGDVFEDVLFAGIVAWTIRIGFGARGSAVYRPLATRFLALTLVALPGMLWDLFLSDGTDWRFYPLWYCVVSVVLTATLAGRRPAATDAFPAAWGLSAREEEVVRLVRQGLSNPEIARALFISPNTVKSHLSAIFDKSGLRTRVALIAALAGAPATESR
jgi:DNA-binding CsgD family transcriptional regulator